MPRLLRGIARTAVVAGTASSVAGRVQHRQQNKWAAQEQAAAPQEAAAPPPPAPEYQAAPPPPPPPPPAATGTDDKLAQLKQLGELRDSGVLTEAEFEAQKGKILYG
jgi:Short C-terminal domain